MRAKLHQVLLLTRDLPKSQEFYQKGIGLQLIASKDYQFAEFDTGTSIPLVLKPVQSEAAASCGYSPFLNFSITDMDEKIPLLLQMGGHLDGPIKYPAFGKVASIRSPDGHMIGLYEAQIQDRAQ